MGIKKQLIAFYTLYRREMVRILRIWMQTLVPPVITMTLYFVIFGHVIGTRIGQMKGVTYVQYIVPGLIMMSIINNAYTNVVSSFFGSKFQRNIEEMLVSPMSNTTIIWGFISGGLVRSLLIGVLVVIVSLFFSHLTVDNVFLTLIVALLSATLFALAGLVNGIFAKSFDDVTIVPTFILVPLTYLGGVFYSVDLLPEFWQKMTMINPIFYMVNAFRYGILGHSDINIHMALSVIVGFIILLYSVCWFLITKGIGLRN